MMVALGTTGGCGKFLHREMTRSELYFVVTPLVITHRWGWGREKQLYLDAIYFYRNLITKL
jgi:hypothetical protein